MPLSFGNFRTDGNTNSPAGRDPYIPLYSVLFYYGKTSDFANTSSGTLDVDYYRTYAEITKQAATFYNSDGTSSSLKSNPLISCVSLDNDWKNQTGLCIASSTNLPNTAATLFNPVTHDPSTMVKTAIYNSFGLFSGERSSGETYIPQTSASTHAHAANNIAAALRSYSFGDPTVDLSSFTGINSIAVRPIIRDPKLTTTVTTYAEKKLNYLPKNVIVFGNNLPSNNYSQDDIGHTNKVNGQVLPLLAKVDDVGVLNIANTLSFTVSTNTAPNHNHNIFPLSTKPKSTKTNQTAYKVVDAGLHTHQVTYTSNVTIRSKILKSYITNKDVTPIANGVIIGFSIGKNTLYPDTYTNSQILPVNWHFCDGNNGTPDLRGYYIYANFDSSNNCHDTVYNSTNTITINSITMAANGNHSHIGPITGQTIANGTPTNIGSHSFEDSLNHVHTISTAVSFLANPTDTLNTLNITTGQSYTFAPPSTQIAFIMYNSAII